MIESLLRDYQLLEEIGRGRFGVVHRCYKPDTDEFFACKTVDKSKIADAVDRENIEREVKIIQLIGSHENLVQIRAVYENDEFIHIIMDILSSQDLFERITHRTFTETEAADVIAQLMEAIAYCHRIGVVHRDVKPDNILFDDWDRLKLIDFGSADCVFDGNETLTGIVGTPYYVAPEVLRGQGYDKKVDIWSAGVVLYIMLSGIPPFYGETPTEIFEAVLRGNLRFPSRIFHSVSPLAKDLMRKMMCKDVSKRLTAEQVLRHPWITSGGQMSVDELA